ncbi:hypothetical protein N431DRAFT_406382 [Stipitochalara longipes BDJ]|nr:hypothetical protein N431DRAFT_406382 [Stipitochalara longipes BDJ]
MEDPLTTNEAFQYNPALLGPRLIRIINLSPSRNKSAPLCIRLKTVCVDNFTSYECLSYTWDGQIPDRPVYCGRKLMLVTANAEAAMCRFRRKHRQRWLWIDAICINQACVEEKNAQVSMMADIYRNARAVLVWLGAGTRDIEKAIAYCHRAICIPLKHMRGVDLPTPPARSRWEELKKQFYLQPNVKWMLEEDYRLCVEKGLDQITQHRYWSRIWTVQEVALSRRSKLYIGDSKPISFEELVYGYDVHEYYPNGNALLYNRDRSRTGLMFHLECARHVREKTVWDSSNTVTIAASLMGKRSTEPRDICFAIKAVYPDLLGNIEVRYDRSIEEIYIEMAAILFNGTWGTKWLGWMLDIASMCLPKSLSFPSWVPDWSSEETAWSDYKHFIHRATSDSKAAGMFSANQHNLHLLGKVVDTVYELVGEPFPDWTVRTVAVQPTLEVEEALRNTHRTLASLQKSSHRKDLAEQFYNLISTMLVGQCLEGVQRYILRGAAEDGSPTSPNDESSISSHGNLTIDCEPTSQRDALLPPNDKLSCRTVFLTGKGRVGLGRVVQPGDELVLLAGTNHPYVVRHTPSRGGYELQASAIVDGMMIGEVWSSVEDNLDYICFI